MLSISKFNQSDFNSIKVLKLSVPPKGCPSYFGILVCEGKQLRLSLMPEICH